MVSDAKTIIFLLLFCFIAFWLPKQFEQWTHFRSFWYLKDGLPELTVAAWGFKFLFYQMESVCGRPWQNVEVR